MRCNDLQTTITIIRSNKLIAKGRRSDDGNDHHRNKPGETQRALLERYENVSRRRLPSDAPVAGRSSTISGKATIRARKQPRP